jgi:hypothetical protein
MATYLLEICDLFLSRVNDFRLNTIFTTSGSLALNTYLEPYLLDSIVEFDVCNQSLAYTTTGSATDGFFATDLNLKNKIILSQIMVKYWLEQVVANVLNMNLTLQDHDYKRFAESQNLKAKQDFLNQKREQVSQLLVDYGYSNNDWTDWRNQNFAP